jgi:signal transduction histidine kinase
MKRLVPQSLFGRMVVVLLAGLVVSQLIAAWIYSTDREAALRQMGGLATAQRIANMTRLVEDAPADWRPRIIASLSDANLHVSLASQRPQFDEPADDTPVKTAIRGYLVEQLALGADRTPLVAIELPPRTAFPFGPAAPSGEGMMMMHRSMMNGGGYRMMGPGAGLGSGLLALAVAIPFADGQWLSFTTAIPNLSPTFSYRFILSLVLMAAVIVGASIWATRLVTAPLTALAGAAQRLGQDVDAPQLAETGSLETRQATHAFNEMQTHLRELIENRTRLLAGISHDLRTPLTLLRLRSENMPEGEDREKMLATIAEMDAMIGVTLQFAREEMRNEPLRRADVLAMLQSIADDMTDAGHTVTVAPSGEMLIECRPAALKRALTNLIENAVKYGKRAEIAVARTGTGVEIAIDDEGPGIPEVELTRVVQPFYRVENSRSRDTGGVGLGLAIAKSLIERDGGKLTLHNRAAGGLQARVQLASIRL